MRSRTELLEDRLEVAASALHRAVAFPVVIVVESAAPDIRNSDASGIRGAGMFVLVLVHGGISSCLWVDWDPLDRALEYWYSDRNAKRMEIVQEEYSKMRDNWLERGLEVRGMLGWFRSLGFVQE